MISEKVNINIFNEWAQKGKDKGMEKGHAASVNEMLEIIKKRSNILQNNFNFLDLGCGNGWVVKKFSNDSMCDLSVGVDGAKNMIDKAKINDSIGQYFQSNIESWSTKDKFDIVFSMETFYYLKNPNIVLSNIYNNFLKNRGMLIIGIDHYFENKPSLSWENEIGIQTQTLSINDWKDLFRKNNFKDIQHIQVGKKDDWSGTLIISAFKN